MNKQLCLISGGPTIKTHISANCKEVISRDGDYIFRGYKAEGLSYVEKQISPADCKINSAVPSELILAKHSAV